MTWFHIHDLGTCYEICQTTHEDAIWRYLYCVFGLTDEEITTFHYNEGSDIPCQVEVEHNDTIILTLVLSAPHVYYVEA